LWLHITTSLGLICRSHGSQQAFRLWHKPYSKINLDCKIFYATPDNIYVDIFGNNPMTKNVGCKIYIVVEITL
jgi:hypothetical protein